MKKFKDYNYNDESFSTVDIFVKDAERLRLFSGKYCRLEYLNKKLRIPKEIVEKRFYKKISTSCREELSMSLHEFYLQYVSIDQLKHDTYLLKDYTTISKYTIRNIAIILNDEEDF